MSEAQAWFWGWISLFITVAVLAMASMFYAAEVKEDAFCYKLLVEAPERAHQLEGCRGEAQ